MWGMVSVFLQACGILLLLWMLISWLVLGKDRGGAIVFLCKEGQTAKLEGFLRNCIWLREMGTMSMPIIVGDAGLTEQELKLVRLLTNRDGVVFCPAEQIEYYLQAEAEQVGGTGTATRNGSGSDISEP